MYAGHILDLRKGTKWKGDIFGGLFSKIGPFFRKKILFLANIKRCP